MRDGAAGALIREKGSGRGTWDDDGTLYLGGLYVVVGLRPRDVGYTEMWLAPPGATRPRPSDE